VLSLFHAAKRKDGLTVSNEIRVRSAKRTSCARTVYHIKILHVKGKFFRFGKARQFSRWVGVADQKNTEKQPLCIRLDAAQLPTKTLTLEITMRRGRLR